MAIDMLNVGGFVAKTPMLIMDAASFAPLAIGGGGAVNDYVSAIRNYEKATGNDYQY